MAILYAIVTIFSIKFYKILYGKSYPPTQPQTNSLEQAALAIAKQAEIKDIQGVITDEVALALSVDELDNAGKMAMNNMYKKGIRPSDSIDDFVTQALFWIPTPILAIVAAYGLYGKDVTDRVDFLRNTALAQGGVVTLTELRKKSEREKERKIQNIVDHAIITQGAKAVVNSEITAAEIVMGQPTAKKLAEFVKANENFQKAVAEFPVLREKYHEELEKYETQVQTHNQKALQEIANLNLEELKKTIKVIAGSVEILIDSDFYVDGK